MTIIEQSVSLAARLKAEGRLDDARIVDSLVEKAVAAGIGTAVWPTSVPAGRRRKPQDLKDWPKSLKQAEVERKIDDKCGCSGKFDCDCISVFNMVRGSAWYEHNAGEPEPADDFRP